MQIIAEFFFREIIVSSGNKSDRQAFLLCGKTLVKHNHACAVGFGRGMCGRAACGGAGRLVGI